MRSTRELFSHAAETVRRERENQSGRRLVEGGATRSTQIKRCKVVGFSQSNTRLSVKEVKLDGTNQEFGNAFDVFVEAFTDTAAGQNNVDLGRHKVHPFFQVGNLIWVELMPDRNWWWRGAVGFVCKEV